MPEEKEVIETQNSILFILIVNSLLDNITWRKNSKFHSVYINSIPSQVMKKLDKAQNSILFILIEETLNRRWALGILKIPFCLY